MFQQDSDQATKGRGLKIWHKHNQSKPGKLAYWWDTALLRFEHKQAAPKLLLLKQTAVPD